MSHSGDEDDPKPARVLLQDREFSRANVADLFVKVFHQLEEMQPVAVRHTTIDKGELDGHAMYLPPMETIREMLRENQPFEPFANKYERNAIEKAIEEEKKRQLRNFQDQTVRLDASQSASHVPAGGRQRCFNREDLSRTKFLMMRKSCAISNAKPNVHRSTFSIDDISSIATGSHDSATLTLDYKLSGKQALIADLISHTKFNTEHLFQVSRRFKQVAEARNAINIDEFRIVIGDRVGDLLQGFSEQHDMNALETISNVGVTIAENETLLRRLFMAFDLDGDGRIDFREFIMGLNAFVHGTIEEKAYLLFDKYGANQSGKLPISDLLGLFQGEQRQFHDLMRCVDEYFARVDENTMTETEFVEASMLEPHLFRAISQPHHTKQFTESASHRESMARFVSRTKLDWNKLVRFYSKAIECMHRVHNHHHPSTTNGAPKANGTGQSDTTVGGGEGEGVDNAAAGAGAGAVKVNLVSFETLPLPDFQQLMVDCFAFKEVVLQDLLNSQIVLPYVVAHDHKPLTASQLQLSGMPRNDSARRFVSRSGSTMRLPAGGPASPRIVQAGPSGDQQLKAASTSTTTTTNPGTGAGGPGNSSTNPTMTLRGTLRVHVNEFLQDIAGCLQSVVQVDPDLENKAHFYFLFYDSEKDNLLSRSELSNAVCAGYAHFGDDVLEIMRVLEEQDSDRDGQLAKDEFIHAAKRSDVVLASLFTYL